MSSEIGRGVLTRLGRATGAIIRAWNAFFFQPVDPLPVALYRVAFGILVMLTIAGFWADIPMWFGEQGVLPRDSAWFRTRGTRINLMLWLPGDDRSVYLFFAVLFGAALMLTVGLFTRTSAVLVFLGLVSFHHRNTLILHSGDSLLRICAFFLIFSEAGLVLSVDRLIRLARGRDAPRLPLLPPWGQRLIQIQLAVVYVSTVYWKLAGEMWRDGTATGITSQLVEFQRFPVPFVFDYLWTVRAVTWTTLAVELALGTLIWVPRLRYHVIRVGILLHLGLEYSMSIPLFQWIMMSTLVCFVAPADLRASAERGRQWLARRRQPATPDRVYYDGDCGFCSRTKDVVAAMDVLHRLEWVDFRRVSVDEAIAKSLDRVRAEREMLVHTSTAGHADTWTGGFDAVRTMCWKIPVLLPIAPVLYLPGVSGVGRAVYRWVARNRFRFSANACVVAAAGTD